MKVLHVAESAKGGVGTYIEELVSWQLTELGSDNVSVLAPDAHATRISALPAENILMFSRPDRSAATLSNLARSLRDVVRDYQPDVIHAHSTFAGLVVRALYGWKRDRPALIYCPHGWSFDVRTAFWKQSLAKLMERVLADFCDCIIAISTHERDAARRVGIPTSKIDVVHNGLSDVEQVDPQPWDDDRLKILFVGRLDRQKGFDVLMDAMAPLANRASVRVAGEAVAGDQPFQLQNSAANVEMLGWLSELDIRGHLAAADVLVVPSRWEGFGLVALEAMRAGRMVVASDVGGLPEVVADGVTGWLVPADSPDVLSKRLATLTRAQAKAMGDRGRDHFLAFFQGDRMHRQIGRVYERCVHQTRVRVASPDRHLADA